MATQTKLTAAQLDEAIAKLSFAIMNAVEVAEMVNGTEDRLMKTADEHITQGAFDISRGLELLKVLKNEAIRKERNAANKQ